MRIVSHLRDWISGIFRGLLPRKRSSDPLEFDDEAFERIDRERLRKDLRLDADAKRYGSKGLPASSDRTEDGPHAKVRQELTQRINEGYRRANKQLQALKEAVEYRDLRPVLDEITQLPQAIRGDFVSELREEKRAMEQATMRRDAAEREISEYRERYGVTREVELRSGSDLRNLIGLTAIALVFQAAGNMVLFAQGLVAGFSAAAPIALIIGVVDVLWHHTCGRIGRRWRAPDAFSKVTGILFSSLCWVSIFVWNLTVVHLRLAIREQGFEEGMTTFVPAMLASPGFSDGISIILFVLGILCSFGAAMTGFSWDEPIPHLQKYGRIKHQAEEEISYAEDQLHDLKHHTALEWQSELEEMEELARNHRTVARGHLDRIQRIHENLQSFHADVSEAYSALISGYRSENRAHRPDGSRPPSYFDTVPELDVPEPLEVDLSTLLASRDKQELVFQRILSALEQQRGTRLPELSTWEADFGKA